MTDTFDHIIARMAVVLAAAVILAIVFK